jgi:hypothetical protein
LPEYAFIPFGISGKWDRNVGIPMTSFEEKTVIKPAELGLQPGTENLAAVVIFDPGVGYFNRTPEAAKSILLPDGGSLEYMEFRATDQLYFDAHSFGLLSD